jgi:hypothetical protein
VREAAFLLGFLCVWFMFIGVADALVQFFTPAVRRDAGRRDSAD